MLVDISFLTDILMQNLLDIHDFRTHKCTIIYNKFYDAAKVMSCPWDKDVERRTGVPYYIAKKVWQNVKYEPPSLLKALRIIQDCESGIKQGRYIELQAVSSCILSILALN